MIKLIANLCLILGVLFLTVPTWADNDAIIDVDDDAMTFTGTWTPSTQRILYYGDQYRYAVCNGNDSAAGAITSEATLSGAEYPDITGRYHVYVRWVTDPNRTDSARYRIFSGATQVGSCTLNQENDGGAWQFCDEVTMTQNAVPTVKIGNNCELNQIVVADGVRFVRVSKDYGDIVDVPGVEYYNNAQWGISGTPISSSCAAMTNLRSIGVTAPMSGYIIVNATGHYDLNAANQWVRLCIDDASGGSTCDSRQHTFEVTSTADGEGDYAISYVYSVSAGTKTFYLKACREASAAGYIELDSFNALYVPRKY